jgi:hypothetical protein
MTTVSLGQALIAPDIELILIAADGHADDS